MVGQINNRGADKLLIKQEVKVATPNTLVKRHSCGKNKSIFDFSSAPPQIINGRPLKR